MPRVVNVYTPVAKLYTSLGQGLGFVPSDRLTNEREEMGSEAWRELALIWASSFHLARRVGRLNEFRLGLMNCPYYSAWAVMAMNMPGERGLGDFLRIGSLYEDGGAELYLTFFQLARSYSLSTHPGAFGPERPFLVNESCVTKSRFEDRVYDERAVVLAYDLADMLITYPARDTDAGSEDLEATHVILLQAFIDAFASLPLSRRKRPGVKRLVVDTWLALSEEQRTNVEWLAPFVASLLPARAKPRHKPAGQSTR